MKKKKIYEHPQTVHTSVEAETGFMNASVVENEPDDNSTVTSGSQEIGGNYDFTEDNKNPWH